MAKFQGGAAAPVYLVDSVTGSSVGPTTPISVNDPGLPDSLGQKTAAGSTSVVLASDQGPITTQATSKGATSADSVTATANAVAAINYAAAGAGVSNVIGMVMWSYSAAPTAGSLKIEDAAANIVFQVDITAAGPGFFEFPRPLKGTVNSALIITLAAGGSGVVGRINARKWTE